jgi:hypothetical protein
MYFLPSKFKDLGFVFVKDPSLVVNACCVFSILKAQIKYYALYIYQRLETWFSKGGLSKNMVK